MASLYTLAAVIRKRAHLTVLHEKPHEN